MHTRFVPYFKRFWHPLAYIFVGLIFGVGVSNTLVRPSPVSRAADLTDSETSDYPLINPLLACGDISDQSVGEMQTLRKDILGTIARAQARGVSHVAVYIRDLNNGPWLGIDEDRLFYPSALLKVPLLLATYREEEEHPGLLKKQLTYSTPIEYTQHLLSPAEPLQLHRAYSVRELLSRAIIYSDDESAALLANGIGFDALSAVFSDFGMPAPRLNTDYQMPVRTYSSFFRVLYNASYVDRAHSEEALEMLSSSPLTNGIVAGVPHGVIVAHKFGERDAPSDQGSVQLHDCGIIYAPKNPYLLCVMAQGRDAGSIIDLLHEISAKAYAAMQK